MSCLMVISVTVVMLLEGDFVHMGLFTTTCSPDQPPPNPVLASTE